MGRREEGEGGGGGGEGVISSLLGFPGVVQYP